ncbi:hypothetical protein [Actinomadura coerulea]|uniref:hypothetical protein n=1 Tax=Actinomadura coerulea TaxID=46159 RepID=UPI003439AB40
MFEEGGPLGDFAEGAAPGPGETAVTEVGAEYAGVLSLDEALRTVREPSLGRGEGH